MASRRKDKEPTNEKQLFDACCDWMEHATEAGTLSAEEWQEYWTYYLSRLEDATDVQSELFATFIGHLEESGKFASKDWLAEPDLALVVTALVDEAEESIPAWMWHCKRQGTPMTVEDWDKSGVAEALAQDSDAEHLFNPDYWAHENDLQPLKDLYALLEKHAWRVREDGKIAPEVTDAAGAAIGKHLAQKLEQHDHEAVKETIKGIPLSLLGHVPNRHQVRAEIGRREAVERRIG